MKKLIHAICVTALSCCSILVQAVPASPKRTSPDDGPLYKAAVAEVISLADQAIAGSTDVPVPVDAVGGPVHQTLCHHYLALDRCGYAYELTGDKRYAEWCGNLLVNYAAIYNKLGYHPESYGNTAEPGRLFWQVLDESVWGMYASRAYLKVKQALPKKQRDIIEAELFHPMAQFLMYGTEDNAKNNYVFNRLHNHGTWQVAAVGTMGLAMGDRTLVDKALLGTDLSGVHGGFLQQIDELFSPDGYYMEGISYQTYALIPFLSFASLVDTARPELHIFDRNSSALAKSADAIFSLAYDSWFFPMNDCDRKGYSSADLTGLVCAIYKLDPSRKWLLGMVADYAGKVTPDEAGRLVSRDLNAGLAERYIPRSCKVTDGGDGSAGAVMVLRGEEVRNADGVRLHDGPTVTMKACGQGSYHGHFDRLGLGYYDDGMQILTDYGSARYTGIGQKEGGRYTKLNRGYAMTTVAHNALVMDSISHYQGVTPYAIPHAPRVIAFDGDASDGLQYMAAVDSTAYDGIRMERWVAMLDLPYLERPLVTDIMIARSGDGSHTYDLPYHFQGQLMALNVPYSRSTASMEPAGKDFGYQHLWVEATAANESGASRFTWLCGERMYTLSSAVSAGAATISMLRAGANDPDYILRPEPAYMLHQEGEGCQVFASCLESHGWYRIQDDIARDLYPSNTDVAIIENTLGTGGGVLKVRYSFGGNSFVLVIDGSHMTIEK